MPSAKKKARRENDDDGDDEVTMPSMPSLIDDDDEDGEGELEESDDGGEDYDEEEEEEEGKLEDEVHKKGKDALFSDPTHDEMKALKETELLFKSSLLQLQINEVKTESSVKYEKLSSLEAWLHSFKDIILSIKARTMSAADLPAGSAPPAFQTFEFKAPQKVHMIGSYLLKSVAKPQLNVDLAIEMPIECVHHKDFLNNKYLDKRTLFLRALHAGICQHACVGEVRFALFRADPRKPILLVKPAHLSGPSSKFRVRLIPSLPEGAFPLRRLRPTRNNIRAEGITDISQQPPTPSYNSCLAEDLRFVHHLQLLHAAFGDCAAFSDAIVLLKVWLRQRGLDQYPDSINGFLVSMLLLYLLQHRLISRHMSSYQMLRSFYTLLANPETLQKGVTLTPAKDCDASKEEALAEFRGAFAATLLDDSLSVNLLSRLSASALLELAHESRAALACLHKDSRDGFMALVLQSVPFSTKYDEYLLVKLGDGGEGAGKREGGGGWDAGGLYGVVEEPGLPEEDGTRTQALSVVDHALANRIYFARACYRDAVPGGGGGKGSAQGWPEGESLEDVMGGGGWGVRRKELLIGLLLNPDHAYRKVDRGPAADDKEAARAYRAFWGDKSELRRFKDGAILESAVWDHGQIGEEKFTVPGQAAQYALRRHIHPPCAGVSRVAGALNAELREGEGDVTQEHSAFSVLEHLTSLLMALDVNKLPLRVMAISPLTTEIRGMSAKPLSAHPLAYRDLDTSLNAAKKSHTHGGKLSLCVDQITCAVTLANSGKWPDDIGAMKRLTAAIYLRMAECLNENEDGGCVAHAHEGHLEVLCKGFAYRLIVWNEREVRVLIADGLKRDAQTLEKELLHRPSHAAALASLAHRFTALPETVRLCKRWLNTHMLSGFIRFLTLLSTHTWATSPLIVDLNFEKDPMSDDLYKDILSHTESLSGAVRTPLLICTATDKAGTRWTKDKPTKMVWRRVVKLATAALQLMGRNVCAGSVAGVRKVMLREELDYDVIIHLQTGPALHKACPTLAAGSFKNLRKQQQKQLLLGFDPVKSYVSELRNRYGRYAMFFADLLHADRIAILWAPTHAMGGRVTVKDASGAFPLVLADEEAMNGDSVPDVVSMLVDMKTLGEGLIKEFQIVDGAKVV